VSEEMKKALMRRRALCVGRGWQGVLMVRARAFAARSRTRNPRSSTTIAFDGSPASSIARRPLVTPSSPGARRARRSGDRCRPEIAPGDGGPHGGGERGGSTLCSPRCATG
jgi:hypothetical protein